MEGSNIEVVLITGASSGIGEGLAYAFASKGASLSLCGRNVENLKKVAEKCVSEGAAKVVEIAADVTKVDDMERMVDETVAQLGQIDVLINNAGWAGYGGIETATIVGFDKVFDVNLKAPYYLIQRCLPHLKKTHGCVINVSSCAPKLTLPRTMHYNMTKVGLDHLTKIAALELGQYGIRVNSVRPGLILTPILEKNFTSDQIIVLTEEYMKKTPLEEKLVTVQEVADVVLFLASSGARSITGTCLLIDRGRCLM
uniref:uncharacterized protein LOC104266190 n=1 Tax=Ciona intestinalis TaxID=7719 RepID=UPI000180CFFF|nr:uncharacterized protein LOC104266190 [Ciona intestinalis]|eukprot:XP_018669473.1 uncharacterized protein LOC104266190 [Ciona intestinalis]